MSLRNDVKINIHSCLPLSPLFFTLKSFIYPDKIMILKQKLSTKLTTQE